MLYTIMYGNFRWFFLPQKPNFGKNKQFYYQKIKNKVSLRNGVGEDGGHAGPVSDNDEDAVDVVPPG